MHSPHKHTQHEPDHGHDHKHDHNHNHEHGLHAHGHGDAKHSHVNPNTPQTRLTLALILTLGFAVVEAGFGWYANSLALISDAGHMVTDAAALGLALMAQIIARRPPSAKLSFGFGRTEALAAFVNALAMLAVVLWIVVEAVMRLIQPAKVAGEAVMAVAAIGLLINIIVAIILSQDSHNLNTRAALTHVMGDLLGSVAALMAGAVIYYTGWMQIDPLLSMLVAFLLIKSTMGVLRESYHILMEGVPHHIDYLQVGRNLQQIEGVLAVHDLHVWEMAPGHSALIGHLEIADLQNWPTLLIAIKAMLLEKHGIDHITLQAETPELARPGRYCATTDGAPPVPPVLP